MEISETKKKIVIDNYFKQECNIDTSIKEAFEKGFNVGLMKAPAKEEVEIVKPYLEKLKAEINEKIDSEAFARRVFRNEENDPQKAEQCTVTIQAYNKVLTMIKDLLEKE